MDQNETGFTSYFFGSADQSNDGADQQPVAQRVLNFEDTEEDLPTSSDSMTDAAHFDGDIERMSLYQPNGDRLRVTMDSNQRANLGLTDRSYSPVRKTCQPDQLKLALRTCLQDDIVEEVPQTQESDEFIVRMAEQPVVVNMDDDESPAILTKQSLNRLQRPKSPSKRKPTFDKGSSCFSISSEKSTLSLMLIGKPGGSFTSMQGEDMTRRSPSFLN